MEKPTPIVVRSEYKPLAWKVTEVHLTLCLDEHDTLVTSVLVCERNRDSAPDLLRLDGEELTLVSVLADGVALPQSRIFPDHGGLALDLPGDRVALTITNRISPAANQALSGLYVSNGGFFTQCEAQGFRRITYFPDRPDIMARYTVRLEADQQRCPVLLSNGNLLEQGTLTEGRHFAVWQDPFPKPSYLFALVAADLRALEKTVKTASGRDVLLQVWVEPANLPRAGHAMASLIHALRWDERTFGLELDLDRFMIVAVSDFNMGAMENKGLNIFNAKYVLADADTATDSDFEHIESVVAHEYFHNWTGNRVTCRDWFQLTLKEGLTVFRDQQFSADMLADAAGAQGADSARAVKRINDVRVLRMAQFTEDAGPMAHPIRPESYQQINNFYTATVYEKGAEVIRMQHTLLGQSGFRRGMDLYFARFDGQAVTCDDFVACMAQAGQRDFSLFSRWYAQSGTPVLRATLDYDAAQHSCRLTLSQHTASTPDQAVKQPLLIPVRIGLIGPEGGDMPLQLAGESVPGGTIRLLELTEARQSYTFINVMARPVLSLLRGFSAPVIVDYPENTETLAFRMAHDSDAFNRWDAAQKYARELILDQCGAPEQGVAVSLPPAFVDAFRALICDAALDPSFRALAAALPSEPELLEQMKPAKPARLRQVIQAVCSGLAAALHEDLLALYRMLRLDGPYRYHPADAGRRALRNLVLRYLVAGGRPEAIALAQELFRTASNMTERMGALTALVNGRHATAQAGEALRDFERRYHDDALVMDKWFALQATAWRWPDTDGAAAGGGLEQMRALMVHPAFKLSNPNKVYALLGGFFRGNPAEFHRTDGAGYRFWAEQVLALDKNNPQVAARMARALENWRIYDESLQKHMVTELERVRAGAGLSSDVAEIVTKALRKNVI